MGSKVTFKYVPWIEGLLFSACLGTEMHLSLVCATACETGIEPVVCWSQGEPRGETEGLSTA